jgi:hypothetical protein
MESGSRQTLIKKIRYCLAEVSDGIKKNCSRRKADHDEEKIEVGVVKFMEFTNANTGHFIRFHSKVSSF